MPERESIAVADLETCSPGDYLVLWADLPPGAARTTQAAPDVIARLAARGLRPAFDDLGMGVLHTDEIDELITSLARRAREHAERIHRDAGGDPECAKQAGALAALRALFRLSELPIEELRQRRAAHVARARSSPPRRTT